MRIALNWILLLACLAGNAQTSIQQDEQKNRLLSLENAWNQAVQQKDLNGLDMLLHEDLIYIDSDGSVMNKTQYLAWVNAPTIHFENIVNDALEVQLYGKSALILGLYHEKGTQNGKPYLHRERFIETWINQNGVWKCVASQSTLIRH
jgi:ketosteroid isomerase-like protein